MRLGGKIVFARYPLIGYRIVPINMFDTLIHIDAETV